MAKNNAGDVLSKMAIRRGGRKPCKTERVLHFLFTDTHGITPMEAFKRYNVTRLGSIIFELRHTWGLEIVTEMETKNGMTYARYFLKEVA